MRRIEEAVQRGTWPALRVILGLGAAYFVIRWALAEYWITTHCTMVLGTRVCQ
jgi:hypothetical protein